MSSLRSKFFVLLFSVFPVIAFSQIVPNDIKTVADSFEIRRILLIPFNQNMYITDCDREMMEKSKLTYRQMLNRLRNGLSIEVHNHIPGWWEPIHAYDDSDSTRDLETIYTSISYKYELLDEKTSGAKKELFKKEEPKEEKKIVKGQIRIEQDNRPKFMNAHIKSDTLLPYLAGKYKAQFILLLNQLDIVSDLSDYEAVANKTYKKNVRVHYTILDQNGEQFFAGLAVVPFPSEVGETEIIISKYFPDAGRKVTAHLPPPVPVKKVKQK